MLEIRESYNQLKISDDQEVLDKRILCKIAKAKERRTRVEIRLRTEDVARASGFALPTLSEHSHVEEEIEAEMHGGKMDDDEIMPDLIEMTQKSFNTEEALEKLEEDSKDFIEESAEHTGELE